MADRIKRRTHSELDKLTRQDASAAIKFNRQPRVNVDELIISLSAAYENKRARQVNEWERIGRWVTRA